MPHVDQRGDVAVRPRVVPRTPEVDLLEALLHVHDHQCCVLSDVHAPIVPPGEHRPLDWLAEADLVVVPGLDDHLTPAPAPVLAALRRAHGAEAAATIARSMVTAPFRTGTQAQFIEHPTHHADRDADTLAGVREHALRHLDEPLTVADLAARAGMSPRSFARHFAAATGTTPLRWLLGQRIAAAQKLLERTDLLMPEVARRAGFGSEVMMRQHFAARLATSPRSYRAAFTGGSNPIAR
ncbi:helix-turn-helix domain-containing protein [Streptomyces tendae]|uniref:helix-turn-helix domain-containing protein n=1 Tax=Streptomyces tendae TaxID=1932 RepID=UPI0036C4FA58